MTHKFALFVIGMALLSCTYTAKAEQSVYKTDAGDFFVIDHSKKSLTFIDTPEHSDAVKAETLYDFKGKAKSAYESAKEKAKSAFDKTKEALGIAADKTATGIKAGATGAFVVGKKYGPSAIKKAKELAENEEFRKMARQVFDVLLQAYEDSKGKPVTKGSKASSAGSGVTLEDVHKGLTQHMTPSQKKKLDEALKQELSDLEKEYLGISKGSKNKDSFDELKESGGGKDMEESKD